MSVRVIGFPKIEIERKLQRNLQTDLLSLCLSTTEAAQRNGRSSELAQGLALLL